MKKSKLNYLAIIIAVASFVFTIYQWQVNMNSRRPRVRVAGFQPELISYPKLLNFIRIYLPKRWFVVNLSDIPISVMSMKMFIKVNWKWHEAPPLSYDSNIYNRNPRYMEDFFPVSITGHNHTSMISKTETMGNGIFFQTDLCPQGKELRHLGVKIELEDHYGNVHTQVLTSKEIRPERIKGFPKLSVFGDEKKDDFKLIEEFTIEDADKDTYAVYVTYHDMSQYSEYPPRIEISYYYKNTSPPWSGNDFYINHESQTIGDDDKMLLVGWKNFEDKKAYLHFENRLPKYLELMFIHGNKPITKIIDLPEELINSFKDSFENN